MVFRAERSSQTEFISGAATGTEMVYWCGNTKGKVKAFTNHCGWQNPFFLGDKMIFLKHRLLSTNRNNMPNVATKKIYPVYPQELVEISLKKHYIISFFLGVHRP